MKSAIFHQSPFGAIRQGLSRLSSSHSLAALGVIAPLMLAIGGSSAHAQSYSEQVVRSFKGGTVDGSFPGNLINVNGMIYGTTSYGGTYRSGTVYTVDPNSHAEKIIYSFGASGSTDGALPNSLIDVNGTLYGTTSQGGTNNRGTVFSINETTHAEKVLHSFAATNNFGSNTDGSGPDSVLDVNGTLYGTAYSGGAYGEGTVFAINESTGAETTVHSFTNFGSTTDGSYLTGSLINVNGILYGTTQSGGTYGAGTVFAIDPTTNAEALIHSFNGLAGDGNCPYAGLLYLNGAVYGTTQFGGVTNLGTVFSVDLTTHAEKVLHSFHAVSTDGDGTSPYDSLIAVNGTLFGTTQTGGAFSINSDGTGYTMLYNFVPNTSDGNTPESNLIDVNGILYGTTLSGGSYGAGTVYSLAPSAGPPVAANDSFTAQYKTALNVAAPGVLGNDNNGGEGPLTATLVTSVSHGTLTLNSDGSFTYTPTGTYIGTDSFTYQVANPVGTGNTATVTITVQGGTPNAVNNSNIVKYETTLSVPSPGVLGNDINSGNGPMTATLVSTVSHGTLTLNSNGAFIYTPAAGFSGTDSFTYQAVNAVGPSNVATATLTVQPATPTAVSDSYATNYKTALTVAAPGVLGNDDTGGKPVTAKLVSNVTHGTLTLNSDGSFTYTPTGAYVGTDSFTYQAVNSVGQSNIATVTITVNPVAPIAINNSNNVKQNTPFTVPAPGVLGNDDNGGSSPLTAVLVTTTTHGTLTLSSNGAFTYTPNPGFTGTDSFTYQAVNSVGTSNIASATLIVK